MLAVNGSRHPADVSCCMLA